MAQKPKLFKSEDSVLAVRHVDFEERKRTYRYVRTAEVDITTQITKSQSFLVGSIGLEPMTKTL